MNMKNIEDRFTEDSIVELINNNPDSDNISDLEGGSCQIDADIIYKNIRLLNSFLSEFNKNKPNDNSVVFDENKIVIYNLITDQGHLFNDLILRYSELASTTINPDVANMMYSRAWEDSHDNRVNEAFRIYTGYIDMFDEATLLNSTPEPSFSAPVQ